MSDDIIVAVTPELIAEHMKALGFRVTTEERNGVVQLASAAQGMGFFVRFGNKAPQSHGFLDYSFGCAVRFDGALPADLVTQWIRTRRFSRLWEQDQLLVLEMDVLVAGGVRPDHLREAIQVWDRLLQEFFLYLKQSRRPAQAAQ